MSEGPKYVQWTHPRVGNPWLSQTHFDQNEKSEKFFLSYSQQQLKIRQIAQKLQIFIIKISKIDNKFAIQEKV